MFHKRINIFTGNFGSGKSEVAVNFAMKLKEENEKVAIVDFDIVNPYFRTMDVKEELEKRNTRHSFNVCKYKCGYSCSISRSKYFI